jgi:hypothetical protein
VKLVRVLIAAAAAIAAAAVFQLASPSAGAADTQICGICWSGGTITEP